MKIFITDEQKAELERLHETTVNHHINEFVNKRKLKPENGGLCRTALGYPVPCSRDEQMAAPSWFHLHVNLKPDFGLLAPQEANSNKSFGIPVRNLPSNSTAISDS